MGTPNQAAMPRPATPTAARRIVLFAAAVLVPLILAGAPSPAVAVTDPEQNLYSFITKARSDKALSAIGLNKDLSSVARKHSARMADQGSLFHTPCLTCRISLGSALAENVGFGGSVRQVHRLLMGSAQHRANVLGDFTQVGVGVVKRGAQYWVTEIFAS